MTEGGAIPPPVPKINDMKFIGIEEKYSINAVGTRIGHGRYYINVDLNFVDDYAILDARDIETDGDIIYSFGHVGFDGKMLEDWPENMPLCVVNKLQELGYDTSLFKN